MKAKWMVGALAAALWGGAALADEYQVKTETKTQTTAPSSSTETWQDPNATLTPSGSTTSTTVQTPPVDDQYSGSHVALKDDDWAMKKTDSNPGHVRGVTVLVGGGIEGYTGSLASQLQAGPEWGATVAFKPTKVLGLELGYSGATNEIENGGGLAFSAGQAQGADIVRNGGRALVSLGLTAAPIQPYIAGGVGIDHYNVRATNAAFHSDNVGNIPLAAGLRTHIKGFTADARMSYGVLFNNDFASQVEGRSLVGVNTINAGRYQGTLSVGTSF